MAGFLTSCVEEIITGKGTLQQIGLFTPNPALFGFLLVFFGGLTAYATARTIYRATNKEMTAKWVFPFSCSSAKPGFLAHMFASVRFSSLPSACDCLACQYLCCLEIQQILKKQPEVQSAAVTAPVRRCGNSSTAPERTLSALHLAAQ